MSLDETMKEHMDAVRSLGNGEGTKMSINDATKVLQAFSLLKGSPFQVKTDSVTVKPFNELQDSGIYFVEGPDNAAPTVKDYQAPANDRWWLLIVINSNLRTLQIAVSDTGDGMYYRNKIIDAWTAWHKLGGVTKPVLIGFVAPRLEVAA